MTEVLHRRFTVACSPAHAFRVFTTQTDLWWPRSHRRNTDALMVMEPAAGGRLVERAADGSEFVMGTITRFEPPETLAFDWYPGSPAAPTTVEISLSGSADATEINIVHRAVSDGAVAAWPGRVALFERGWDTIVPALARWISENKED